METTYYVVTIRRDDQRVSYALRLPGYLNLWPVLTAITFSGLYEIETLTAFHTKKEAVATADAWNKTWEDKECRMRFYQCSSYAVWK